MGRPGSGLDDAVIESWHSTLEFELRSVQHFATKAEARAAGPVGAKSTPGPEALVPEHELPIDHEIALHQADVGGHTSAASPAAPPGGQP